MTLFGDKSTFAFGVGPLAGAPDEADRGAAATWASLEIWVRGENLTSHTHVGASDEHHEGLHWPIVYLARWLVRCWPSFFERQAWPIRGLFRSARDLCRVLDAQLADTDVDAPDYDKTVDRRDAFVLSHALSSATAGGLVPDLYLSRDGGRLSLSWGPPEAPTGVLFEHASGEADVPVDLFLDAARGLIGWVLQRLDATSDPACAADRALFSAWLAGLDTGEAAERVLLGYAGAPAETASGVSILQKLEEASELPDDWRLRGSALDASAVPAMVVFRAVAAVLSADQVIEVLHKLRQFPRTAAADDALSRLRAKLPSPAGMRTDHQQGYWLAIALRRLLGNEAEPLAIEQWLAETGVPIEPIDLDKQVDGGAVWDAEHGPVVLVNDASKRASSPWGRRMVIAHELCHLLVDRSAAAPLKVISSAWGPPVLERRANAFAAELLLPKRGIIETIGVPTAMPDEEEVGALMNRFGVGYETCTWHVRNRFRILD